jgi:hypothetical protein
VAWLENWPAGLDVKGRRYRGDGKDSPKFALTVGEPPDHRITNDALDPAAVVADHSWSVGTDCSG